DCAVPIEQGTIVAVVQTTMAPVAPYAVDVWARFVGFAQASSDEGCAPAVSAAILLDFRSLILQRARTWVGLPATAMCSSNVPPYLGFCHETAKRAVLWPHVWQFRDGNISARRVGKKPVL